jgi:hypothetical protein
MQKLYKRVEEISGDGEEKLIQNGRAFRFQCLFSMHLHEQYDCGEPYLNYGGATIFTWIGVIIFLYSEIKSVILVSYFCSVSLMFQTNFPVQFLIFLWSMCPSISLFFVPGT